MSLEERIARLEAIEDIKQLKARYFQHCDAKQPQQVRECFVDGPMEIDYGRVGSFDNADDMVAEFERLACEDHIVEMHHAQNPQIEVRTANEASGYWGLYYHMSDLSQQVVIQLGGYYEDEYRCMDGEWKISATRYRLTSTQIMDVSGESPKLLFVGREAPAELDDPSRQAAS